MATTPTQMRLTDDDKKMLDWIKKQKRLPDRTSANRFALACCVATLQTLKKKADKSFVAIGHANSNCKD